MNLLDSDWKALWGNVHEMEPQGVVYTKPEIVSLILDLAGYTVGKGRLAKKRVLEPSCGDGAFIVEVVARLIASEKKQKQASWSDEVLKDALRASDISEEALQSARWKIVELLSEAGCPLDRATELAEAWTVHADFLLLDWPQKFDLVVGNPPYVRIEDLPRNVLEHYRNTFDSMTDRADLYVPFIEKGLSSLSPDGALAFICANRWTKNQYGRVLRKQVAERFHVRFYLNLEHTQPFLSDVSAYPAVIVIDRKQGEPTKAATLEDIEPETLATVRKDAKPKQEHPALLSLFKSWYPEGGVWTATCDQEHEKLAQLHRFPLLQDSAPGTKVSIGVATGADRVFVLQGKHPDIEEDRQIPLLMASNVSNQGLSWSGKYLINPFDAADDGSLVDLKEYPGLRAYYEKHGTHLRGRHVAKKSGDRWYRTIDRVWPELTKRPKLMIPDIQGPTTIGLDTGQYYPHHNLYYIVSDSWDLRALKTLLRSSIVRQQVRAYSVQMRGGALRFQAGTLRKVRVPLLASLSEELIGSLAAVAESQDQAEIDAVAGEAYQ